MLRTPPCPTLFPYTTLFRSVGHWLTGGGPLQRLQPGHLIGTDRVRVLVLLQGGRLEVGVTNCLDPLLKDYGVLLAGVEPIPFLVRLQVGLTEVTPHLSHRDRWHDAALDDFRDQLTSCPMGDGPTGLRRWFTGDGQDL